MKFVPLPLAGAYLVEPERIIDERGSFARVWCGDEFAAHGIAMQAVQASVSRNAQKGTLRGLHFQWPPSQEGKLVRCERGRIHDVAVDLRPDSPTFTRHYACELDALSGRALYIPPGFAHGFQTLEDDCDVHYTMSDAHRPELAGGVRYDDPAFGIAWPLPAARIALRDRTCPDFDRAEHARRFAQGSA